MIRAVFFSVCLIAAAANSTFAQAPPPAAPAEATATREWQSLSPDQQHLLQGYQDKWNSLPPDRQQSLAKGSQRWLSMTPEQRSSAQQRFSQWRSMPPEQRQELRNRWQQFQTLPPEQLGDGEDWADTHFVRLAPSYLESTKNQHVRNPQLIGALTRHEQRRGSTVRQLRRIPRSHRSLATIRVKVWL